MTAPTIQRAASLSAAEPWQLRVMAWNIWELRGDLDLVRAVIADTAPDVLLVQEAPRLFAPHLRLHRFARQCDLNVLVGGFGGRGLAILATDEVRRQVIRRGMHPVAQHITDLNATYPRGVAAVRLSIPGGGSVVVSSVHFALQEPNRMAHAQHVLGLVRAAKCPVIVGGDLNETADGEARTALAERLQDPAPPSEFTFPAAKPSSRIDAILTTPEIGIDAAHAITETARVAADQMAHASDHLPTVINARILPAQWDAR